MIKRNRRERGSVTVEAAIILPILICAVMTIGMFCKVYYVHEIINHALTETANELSAISYLYYISGGHGIQEDLDEKLEKYSDLKNVTEIEGVLSWLMASTYDNGKVKFGNVVVKELTKKNLKTGDGIDVNDRLKNLNIIMGWDGMDFSHSRYLINGQDIDIIVSYKMDLPLPIKFITDIPIIQRVSLRAWMEGSLPRDFLQEETDLGESKFPEDLIDEIVEAGFDVWSLPVFNRGREIKRILGRNLHENFPIIDSLKGNNAISIRTHDTRRTTNQGRGFYYQLTADIRQLEEFKERSYKGVVISPEDYQGKILNIVIPDVELTEDQIKNLRDAKTYAAERNINIKITVVK